VSSLRWLEQCLHILAWGQASLGRCSKAVVASLGALTRGRFPPIPFVMSTSGRVVRPVQGSSVHRPDVRLGEVEGGFVFGAGGAIEELPAAEAHLWAETWPSSLMRCLQGHARVDRIRGIGAAELMQSDLPSPAASAARLSSIGLRSG
jgi:hypothetical protein